MTAVGERYTLCSELGRGGMATVHRAHDARHGRDVAVKVMLPSVAESLGAERFLREIETAARLQHPHIVPVFDSGNVDGQLFFVMPLIEGESLRATLQREGRLDVEEANREEFYRWISRGIDERDPFALSLSREFLWNPARHEPEFQNLLRRVGLT